MTHSGATRRFAVSTKVTPSSTEVTSHSSASILGADVDQTSVGRTVSMELIERSDEGESHGVRDWVYVLASACLFAAGFWIVHLLMFHVNAFDEFQKARLEYQLWVVLLGATFGFAVAAVPHYFRWLGALSRDSATPIRAKQYVTWIGLILAGLALLYLSIGAAGGKGESDAEQSLTWPVGLITVSGLLLAIPGLLHFFVIAAVAADEVTWRDKSDLTRMHLVIRLRGEIRRLLGTLGVLLMLSVLSTGIRRRALLALGIAQPPEFVILYGLAYAGLLGLVFVLATRGVSTRANLILNRLAPIPSPEDVKFRKLLARRRDLGSLIGGGGAFESFQTAVVIAGPLITALLGNALDG
jgi:hypothetical protein